MKNLTNRGFWYGFNITAGILSLCFILLVPILQAYEEYAQSVDIGMHQSAIANTLQKTAIDVTVLNTEGTPLNAVEFEVHYDPQALFVTDIVPTDTLCEERFILTNTISNASGTAFFQCGTVTPFSGTTGILATMYVVPLRAGTSSFSFGSTTHVLAHDGYGTDATRERTDLVFTSL